MCVIMGFAPGTMPEKEHLTNAVHNNWHSWGIILKDANNKCQMLKDCPEGGNNPELIWKMLEDNKDIERILHLRHNTKGATNLENAQPFQVYSDNELDIYFMHNGTLYQFGSNLNTADAISDTREFCDKVLVPSLERWHGPLGKADYTDKEYWKLVMERPWSTASRGLFVSNKYPSLAVGDGWVKYNQGKNGDITASNDTYFEKVTRGPEFERLEKIRKDEAAAKQASLFREKQDTTPTSSTRGSFGTAGGGIKVYAKEDLAVDPAILTALNHIHDDIAYNDDEEIIKGLYAPTYEELVSFVSEESIYTIAALIQRLSEAAYTTLCDKRGLESDIERKDKFIAALRQENSEMKKGEAA